MVCDHDFIFTDTQVKQSCVREYRPVHGRIHNDTKVGGASPWNLWGGAGQPAFFGNVKKCTGKKRKRVDAWGWHRKTVFDDRGGRAVGADDPKP